MAKVKKEKNKPHGYWSNPDNLLAELAKFDNNWAEFCKAHPSGSRIAYRDKLVEKLGIERRAYQREADLKAMPRRRISAVPISQ